MKVRKTSKKRKVRKTCKKQRHESTQVREHVRHVGM